MLKTLFDCEAFQRDGNFIVADDIVNRISLISFIYLKFSMCLLVCVYVCVFRYKYINMFSV